MRSKAGCVEVELAGGCSREQACQKKECAEGTSCALVATLWILDPKP